jgi:hypothetical protein
MMTTVAPGYWMNETSGVLRPVVERWLNGRPLTAPELATMRAYLRQWMAGDWQGPAAADLRARVDLIRSNGALDRWLSDAADVGIDPL